MTLRTALFLLSTCWLLPLLAQPAHNAPNRTDEKGRKQGEWAKAWPGGTLRYQGQFKDDRPVGLFRYFDEEAAHLTGGACGRWAHQPCPALPSRWWAHGHGKIPGAGEGQHVELL